MKLAFLVQAHAFPDHLARMLERLESASSRFYLHVDAKSDLAPFQGLIERFGVVPVDERVEVFWAGFSQVRATLSLLRTARARDSHDYYVLLSGVDYPIKPLAEIFAFFEGRDVGFLDYFDPCATRVSQRQFYNRHRKYQFRDSPFWSRRGRRDPLSRFLEFAKFTSGMMFIYNMFVPRKEPPVKPFNGSQWWMLPEVMVDEVLRTIREEPALVQHYDNTYAPDEAFFQTLLLNSRYAYKVDGYGNNDRNDFPRDALRDHSPGVSMGRGAYRYVDWTKGRGHPSVLDERDLGPLLSSPCLFARKFHPVRSSRLLHELDRLVHGVRGDG